MAPLCGIARRYAGKVRQNSPKDKGDCSAPKGRAERLLFFSSFFCRCGSFGSFCSLSSSALLSSFTRNSFVRVVADFFRNEASSFEETCNTVGRLSALSEPELNALYVQFYAVFAVFSEKRL